MDLEHPNSSQSCPIHQENLFCHCESPMCGEILCLLCSQGHKCLYQAKTTFQPIEDCLISNFFFRRHLGAGAIGSVYDVESDLDDKPLAIKVIRNVERKDFAVIKREVKYVSKINHPHLLKYFNFQCYPIEKILTITTELGEDSLARVIDQLDNKNSIEIFRQMCEGVRALHKCFNRPHGNLKPENILLKDNIVKMSDFADFRKSTLTAVGSNGLEYLAPETLIALEKNEGRYSDEKTDIWALGIILHKMMAGNIHPFLEGVPHTEFDKLSVISYLVNSKQPQISPLIQDAKVIEVIQRCLSKDSTKRADISEVISSLGLATKEVIEKRGERSRAGPFKQLFQLEGHTYWLRTLCFSDDGSKILSGSGDHQAKLWDYSARKQASFFKNKSEVTGLCFSKTNPARIFCGCYTNGISEWDTTNGKLLRTFEDHPGWLFSLDISPDGAMLASGSTNNTIILWDVRSGKVTKILASHNSEVRTVCFSPDGRKIASGAYDKTVKLWEVASGQLAHTLDGHSDFVYSVHFSYESVNLASGSRDCSIKLWDVSSGRLMRTFEGHTGWVNTVRFSHKGTIVSGSSDKTVKVWDAFTGELLESLEGHKSWVNTVALSRDGARLASGSDDKTIILWERIPRGKNGIF